MSVEPRGLPVPEFDAERLFVVLDRHGAEYVVVGALAAVLHAVAAPDDVIASKRAAGRPKDLAALPALEETRRRLRGSGLR